MRTSTAPREGGSVTSLVEPARAPDLTPEREHPPELDSDHGPRPSGLHRVCSITRRTRLMRSQGCQRRASVLFTSSSARARVHRCRAAIGAPRLGGLVNDAVPIGGLCEIEAFYAPKRRRHKATANHFEQRTDGTLRITRQR